MAKTTKPPKAVPARSSSPTKKRDSTSGRRRSAALAGLAALAVGGALVGTLVIPTETEGVEPLSAREIAKSITVPGDLDGDDKVSEKEKQEAEQAEVVATGIADKLLAPESRRNVTSLVVTPPGQDWWEFVTSYMTEIRLYTSAPPQGVNWYAVTWAKRAKDSAAANNAYPMLHLAFEDDLAAGEFAGLAASNGRIEVALRGNVISLAPLGVRTLDEKLPTKLTKIKDEKQTTGYWAIDYSQKIAVEAANSPWPDRYKAFWTHLGFADAQWTAVARHPARWVGKLTEWDQDGVDLLAAMTPLSKGADEDKAAPLQPAADSVFLMLGESTQDEPAEPMGPGNEDPEDILPTWVGQQVIVPQNTEVKGMDGLDLMMVFDNSFMTGFDMSGWKAWDAPLSVAVYWVYDDVMIAEMRPRPTMFESTDDPTPQGPGPEVDPTDTVKPGLPHEGPNPEQGNGGLDEPMESSTELDKD